MGGEKEGMVKKTALIKTQKVAHLFTSKQLKVQSYKRGRRRNGCPHREVMECNRQWVYTERGEKTLKFAAKNVETGLDCTERKEGRGGEATHSTFYSSQYESLKGRSQKIDNYCHLCPYW